MKEFNFDDILNTEFGDTHNPKRQSFDFMVSFEILNDTMSAIDVKELKYSKFTQALKKVSDPSSTSSCLHKANQIITHLK